MQTPEMVGAIVVAVREGLEDVELGGTVVGEMVDSLVDWLE